MIRLYAVLLATVFASWQCVRDLGRANRGNRGIGRAVDGKALRGALGNPRPSEVSGVRAGHQHRYPSWPSPAHADAHQGDLKICSEWLIQTRYVVSEP